MIHVYIKRIISEFGLIPSIMNLIDLCCDNNGAIIQDKEPAFHKHSKCTLRCYHLIREIIDKGNVKICKVSKLKNIDDSLTKPFA